MHFQRNLRHNLKFETIHLLPNFDIPYTAISALRNFTEVVAGYETFEVHTPKPVLMLTTPI